MKISEKDRGQILRMAGNIACGFASQANPYDLSDTGKLVAARVSAEIALLTLQEVDKLIAEQEES